MKKFLFFIVSLFVLVALLPLIGNKLIQDALSIQITKLRESGIEVRQEKRASTYLTSKIHYEFLLKDTHDFGMYLNEKSTTRISKEFARFLQGAVFGVDLEYFNIPYLNNLSIDIYPLFFSKQIGDELQAYDKDYYNYISNFLRNKGILYHLDYDMLTEEFIGYIKDIDEEYTLKNGATMIVRLLDTTYKGKGDLRTPVQLHTHSKRINFLAKSALQSTSMDVEEFNSLWTMDSEDKYNSNIKVKDISFGMHDKFAKETSLNLHNMDVNVSSSVSGERGKIELQTNASKIFFKSNYQKVQMDGVEGRLSLSDLDKYSKRQLEALFAKSNIDKPSELAVKLKSSFITLLSKGANIELHNLSTKNLNMDGVNMGGFVVSSKVHLKQDKYFSQRINYPIMFMAKTMEMYLDAKVSKPIYKKILQTKPFLIFMQFYVKERNGEVTLSLSFKNGRFKINGRSLPWFW